MLRPEPRYLHIARILGDVAVRIAIGVVLAIIVAVEFSRVVVVW